MWSVWQTCRTGRRAAGFLGGLLAALLLAAGPAAGATFSDPMTLSNGGATTPAVAVSSSGHVYVAWKEGSDIFFTRSLPSQSSCTGPGRLEFASPAVNVSNVDASKVNAGSPSIAANDAGGVYIAWRELPLGGTGGIQSVRFRSSADGGVTFAGPQALDFNRAFPNFPAVAADDGGVYVAWQDMDPATMQNFVVVAQSLAGGPFSYANVTANRPSSRQPFVASDGTTVHVLWRETSGIWYKGFPRGAGLSTAGGVSASPLSAAPGSNLRIAARGSQVTAAWLEGGNIKARTMKNGVSFDPEETVHSSTLSLSNVSLSIGGLGQFVAWQEASFTTFTSSIRHRVGAAAPETLRSGDSFTMNPAAPSGGGDAAERLVAAWQENGAAGTEIKLAYTGGSGSGAPANAWVEMTPNTLNAKTMYQGEGVFTLRIRVPGLGAGAFDVKNLNLTLNGQSLVPIRGSVGDADGDGTAELELKFRRSDLQYVFGGATLTAAQRDGNYTVAGNTSAGCFSGSGGVRIQR